MATVEHAKRDAAFRLGPHLAHCDKAALAEREIHLARLGKITQTGVHPERLDDVALAGVADGAALQRNSRVGEAVNVDDRACRCRAGLRHGGPEGARVGDEARKRPGHAAREGPRHHSTGAEPGGDQARPVKVDPGRDVGDDGVHIVELRRLGPGRVVGPVCKVPVLAVGVEGNECHAKAVCHGPQARVVHRARGAAPVSVGKEDRTDGALHVRHVVTVTAVAQDSAVGLLPAGEGGRGQQ